MHNVDTIDISMSTLQYKTVKPLYGFNHQEVDWQHTRQVNNKIKRKMWLDKTSKSNIDQINNCVEYGLNANQVEELYKRIKYHLTYGNGYIFCFNEYWNSLSAMLPHFMIEEYDEAEILGELEFAISTCFELEEDEMNELKLNRLDIKCDFKYKNQEEFNIIKNILEKAPDQFYTYKKYIKDIKDDVYLFTYLAVRKHKYVDSLIRVEG